MNVLWPDNAGSFLDSLATDASNGFASFVDDGATLWSSPSSSDPLAGLGSLLWSDSSAATDPNSPPAGLLWADRGGSTSTWSISDPTFSAPTGTGGGSLLWQALLPEIQQISTILPSSFDSLINSALDVLWTATGGTGQPPFNLPITGAPQLPTGFLPSTFGALLGEQVVWTDPSQGLHGITGSAPPTTLPISFGGPTQPLGGLLSLFQPHATA
jgi:hypothetical protein